jgi:hypothetical protein
MTAAICVEVRLEGEPCGEIGTECESNTTCEAGTCTSIDPDAVFEERCGG